MISCFCFDISRKVQSGTPEHGGEGGSAPALLMLSSNIIFSHFLRTFVFLPGLTSLCPQEFMTCHEIQQRLRSCL